MISERLEEARRLVKIQTRNPRRWIRKSGPETLLVGGLAAGAAYGVGVLLKGIGG